MWNLKRWYKKNLFTKQIQTHRLRKQTYGNQSRKVGGEGDKLGIWDVINSDPHHVGYAMLLLLLLSHFSRV